MFKNLKKVFISILTAALMITSMPFPVHAKDTGVFIDSVMIVNDQVQVKTTGAVETDDGLYHLYELSDDGTQKEVGSGKVQDKTVLIAPFSDVFKAYQICGKVDGAMMVLNSGKKYISNPEIKSKKTVKRIQTGKKGLLPSALLLSDIDLITDLGIEQVVYNMRLGDICTDGDIPFTYEGTEYLFNSGILAQYDFVLKTMEQRGIQVTMILLNNMAADQTLIYPDSRGGVSNYYALNAADKAGIKKIKAIAAFLADRYSGGEYGTVDNWIIGNEVNAYGEWNYVPDSLGLQKYAEVYAKAFRIFYNTLKSVNGNARVYISLDNQWSGTKNSHSYPGKEFLTKFNDCIKKEGNINWGVAIHPYCWPLTDTDVWNMDNKKEVRHDAYSNYVTMQNLEVFTDYMSSPSLKAPNGEMRSIMLSEQGYTSSGRGGEKEQAAAIVFAYQKAKRNPDIDGFILNRQQDAEEEMANGLALGLMTLDGTKKLSYEWYKNADSNEIQNQVASYIGVSSLDDVLKKRYEE